MYIVCFRVYIQTYCSYNFAYSVNCYLPFFRFYSDFIFLCALFITLCFPFIVYVAKQFLISHRHFRTELPTTTPQPHHTTDTISNNSSRCRVGTAMLCQQCDFYENVAKKLDISNIKEETTSYSRRDISIF